MGKQISRRKAAELLGCTVQTISNYASSGLIDQLPRTTAGGKVNYYYDEGQLKALSPALTRVSTLKKKIETEEAGLRAELQALQEKRREALEDINALSGGLYRLDRYRDFIASTWTFAFRAYPEMDSVRVRKVVDALATGKTLTEMSEMLNVSNERMGQILSKMTNQLNSRRGIEKTLEIYQRENWELTARVRVLKAQLEAAGLNADSLPSGAAIPLAHCGLSSRTFNIFHWGYEFSTLGEVATLTEEQLRATRNLGAKGYQEILRILHENGLHLKGE